MPVGFALTEDGNLITLTIPSFTATGAVVHAFTTRHTGVSQAPFDSMNMDFKVGDDPQNVINNRERVCVMLGAGLDRLVAADQIHDDRVLTVDFQHAGRGARSNGDALPGVDALVTAEPGLILSSYYADCVPLFFLDPFSRVVALAHAGWKGSVLRIGEKTIRHMVERHGCRAANILVAVGPSIGPCCYEVDEKVVAQVEKCLPGASHCAAPGRPGHWWLDLPELNRRVLLQAGIKAANITLSGYCTACREDLFFSHRKQSGRTGRMASFIMLSGG
ncbi:MAG: multicopper polyphenol oxidase [Peptococcaceae bacterium BRH_c8a]|nr:MAG: multicopper polyphenol oxidase [Peptococcaceae bacterium BRH_c8a]